MLVQMWSKRNAPPLLMATQSGTVTVEDSVLMSYNIKHQSLPYNAAGAFFSIHPKEFKTQVHIKT